MSVKEAIRVMRIPFQDEFPIGVYDVNFNSDNKLIEDLKQAAKNERCIGLLSPQPGRGKTHLATGAMLLHWQNNFLPANLYRFERADVLAHKLEKAGVGFKEQFEEYTSYRCLCMDELGRNLQRGDRLELTQMVIYKLFDHGHKLIFTSPLTIKEFEALFDGSIIDRMNEGLVVELSRGRSYRQSRPPSSLSENLGPLCTDQNGRVYRSFPGRTADCHVMTGNAEDDKESWDRQCTIRENRRKYQEKLKAESHGNNQNLTGENRQG